MADESNIIRDLKISIDKTFTSNELDIFCLRYFRAYSEDIRKIQDREEKILSFIRYVTGIEELEKLEILLKTPLVNDSHHNSQKLDTEKNEQLDDLDKIYVETLKPDNWDTASKQLRDHIIKYRKDSSFVTNIRPHLDTLDRLGKKQYEVGEDLNTIEKVKDLLLKEIQRKLGY